MVRPEELLGCSISDPRLNAFINADICDRRTEKIGDCYYIECQDKGVSIRFNEELVITTVYLYSGRFEEYAQYSGELPCNLHFDYSLLDVRSQLGEPEHSGGNTKDFLGNPIPLWDRYLLGSVYLHIQYSEDPVGINLITLMQAAGSDL